MNDDVRAKLAKPIDGYKWRLQQVTPKAKPPYAPGTRGMFMAYIDARDVYDRLDDVFGVGGWSRQVVAVNADGSVIGRIRVVVDNAEIVHEDVGYRNNPDSDSESEPLKAAASDAYKRAAVGLGIGRFLYELEPVWREVDKWGKPLQEIGAQPNPMTPGALTGSRPANEAVGSTPVPIGPPTLAQQVRREAPVKNDGEPPDEPCEVPGCELVCAGKFVGFSRRTYDLVLCAKHSKRAKDGALDLDAVKYEIATGTHVDHNRHDAAQSDSLPPQSDETSFSAYGDIIDWTHLYRLIKPMGYHNLTDISRATKKTLDEIADLNPQQVYELVQNVKP